MLNSIEQLENDFRASRGGHAWPVSGLDSEFLMDCTPCYGCRQVRPCHRFGYMIESPWDRVSDRVSQLENLLGNLRHALPLRNLSTRVVHVSQMKFDSDDPLCLDCILQHPGYLAKNNRALRWMATVSKSETPISRVLLCVECKELKDYTFDDDERGIETLSRRQLDAGVCYECWQNNHKVWSDAKGSIESRQAAIRREIEALTDEEDSLTVYENWMKFVRVPSSRTHVSGRAIPPCCVRDEPPRPTLLKYYPAWTKKLQDIHAEEVGSQLAKVGFVLPEAFKARGPGDRRHPRSDGTTVLGLRLIHSCRDFCGHSDL